MRARAWAGPVAVLVAAIAGCDGPPPTIAGRSVLAGHAAEVDAIAFRPDGRALASRGADSVRVWDLGSAREIARFPQDGNTFGGLAYAPDGRTLAADFEGGVAIHDPAAGPDAAPRRLARPKRPEIFSADVASYGWGLAFAPGGRALAGGGSNKGSDGYVTVWDLASGEGVDLGQHAGPVGSVAYSPDGQYLASKGIGGRIELWDAASRNLADVIQAGRSVQVPVVFAPDGKALASAGEGRLIQLWAVKTGDPTTSLKGHLKAVLGLAYHPGGRVIAGSDAGGTIYLWDISARKPIAQCLGHKGKVWAVAFSPDGRTLASGGEDRTVRLWDVAAAVASVRSP